VVVGVVTATLTAPLVVPVVVVDHVQPLAHQPAAQGPQAKATPVATCPQRQAHLRPVVVVQAQSVPTQPTTSPVTVVQAFPPPSTAQPHSVPVAVAVGHPRRSVQAATVEAAPEALQLATQQQQTPVAVAVAVAPRAATAAQES
jgi:hypothetical protein